ncbi:FMN-binding protein MioC [Colwellia sp. MEBiC06753]
MRSFQIIVGSMLGGTEYVAEACEQQLNALGYQTQLHFDPKFDDIPSQDQTWLICTSTHGAGDYPDNIQPFVNALTDSNNDLNHTPFLVIGVGDSNYDTFCFAAKNIESLLISKGYKKMTELYTIDMAQDVDPEQLASDWIMGLHDQLS